jgi:hypothetical protein
MSFTGDGWKEIPGIVVKTPSALLGKEEDRFKIIHERFRPIDTSNKTDFKSRIYEYRKFLTDMNIYFDPKLDSDLLNIRDEILGDINQFLYLMTFN